MRNNEEGKRLFIWDGNMIVKLGITIKERIFRKYSCLSCEISIRNILIIIWMLTQSKLFRFILTQSRKLCKTLGMKNILHSPRPETLAWPSGARVVWLWPLSLLFHSVFTNYWTFDKGVSYLYYKISLDVNNVEFFTFPFHLSKNFSFRIQKRFDPHFSSH